MDKNSLVGPFLSHSPSRVYRGDGAIRFSGEARYKYLHAENRPKQLFTKNTGLC